MRYSDETQNRTTEDGSVVNYNGPSSPETGGITGNTSATVNQPTQPKDNRPYAQQWLDWATQTYGQGQRGAGFTNVDPNGLQSALDKFYQATGVKGTISGSKGDKVSFNGEAPIDVLYASGSPQQQYWSSDNSPWGGASSPALVGSPVSASGGIPPSQGLQAYSSAAGSSRTTPPLDLSTAPAYQATQFSDPLAGQSNALMAAILSNPQTMNPNVVAQMKEAQKEQALLMAQQGQQQADQANVARGTLGSGYASADASNRVNDAINNILTGNRNVDMTAAQTNRGDELNALNAALALRSRGIATQQAQADENYRASSDAVDRLIKQFGLNSGSAQLAQGAYGQDLQQLLENARLAEQAREANNGLAYNYNALDQSGQANLLGVIQSILNGK